MAITSAASSATHPRWHVLGLQGTGSFDYAVHGERIDPAFTFPLLEPVQHRGGDVFRIGLFGITAAGGSGWQLAEWIVDGEPTVDLMGVDPRRFGPYAGRGYLKQKNEEAYANVFTPHYPDEERVAARPLKTTPC